MANYFSIISIDFCGIIVSGLLAMFNQTKKRVVADVFLKIAMEVFANSQQMRNRNVLFRKMLCKVKKALFSFISLPKVPITVLLGPFIRKYCLFDPDCLSGIIAEAGIPNLSRYNALNSLIGSIGIFYKINILNKLLRA